MSPSEFRLADMAKTVSRHRVTGETLARRGDTSGAAAAYSKALHLLESALRSATVTAVSPADEAELHGLRGGILRRMDRLPEALASYRQGARVERDAALASTYNRSNAIKLALIAGESTLQSVEQDLSELIATIETTTRRDVASASDGWTYADLGDAMLLLGRAGEAIDAYRTFSNLARSYSPTVTLGVLREIERALHSHHDANAPRLSGDLDLVEEVLTPQ
jgi:tetratricopeptide (TPR) repeat protein